MTPCAEPSTTGYITDPDLIYSITSRLRADAPIHQRISYFRATPAECRQVLQTFEAAASATVAVNQDTWDALKRFMAAGLERYRTGAAPSLDHAFGLVRRAGNPNARAFLIRYQLAVEVDAEKTRRGCSLEEALAAVTERSGKKYSYVRDAHRDFAPILSAASNSA